MRDYSVVSQRGPEEGAKCYCIFHCMFFHCSLLSCPIKRSDIFPSPFKQITRVQASARITHWIYGSNGTMLPASHYPLYFPLQEKITAKSHGRNINPWFMCEIFRRPVRTQRPSSALFSVQAFGAQRAQWPPSGCEENEASGVRASFPSREDAHFLSHHYTSQKQLDFKFLKQIINAFIRTQEEYRGVSI